MLLTGLVAPLNPTPRSAGSAGQTSSMLRGQTAESIRTLHKMQMVCADLLLPIANLARLPETEQMKVALC